MTAPPDTVPARFSPQARRRARRYALQALYQWHMTQEQSREVIRQFLDEQSMAKVDVEYFKALVYGVIEKAEHLDERFSPLLDRTVSQLDPVELTVLRIGTYELTERIEIPLRVVINEGVELAKTFGGEQSHRYINGVLDRVAADVRQGL